MNILLHIYLKAFLALLAKEGLIKSGRLTKEVLMSFSGIHDTHNQCVTFVINAIEGEGVSISVAIVADELDTATIVVAAHDSGRNLRLNLSRAVIKHPLLGSIVRRFMLVKLPALAKKHNLIQNKKENNYGN